MKILITGLDSEARDAKPRAPAMLRTHSEAKSVR